MTRDEMAMHMVQVHDIPLESVENRSTMELIQDHFTDHQSVISLAKGLSDHTHSEFLEVEGIPWDYYSIA
jgi:glycerol-3-phosphate dehydrogenase